MVEYRFPDKPISRIQPATTAGRTVLDRERDLIEVVAVNGQSSYVPWFKCSRDGKLICMVNAAHVELVEYFDDV